MSEQSPEVPAAQDVDTEVVPNDPLARRRSSRRTWIAVAAVSALGVAVVGGTAYAIGANTATASNPKPAFTLSTQQGNGSATSTAPTAAGGLVARDTKLSPGMMPYWGGGHVTFTADPSLSAASGSAVAYAFDSSGTDPQAVANDLAKALGIDGSATQNGYQWVVGPQDGSGPNVSVSLDGQVSFNFYDPSADPFSCGVSKAVPPSGAPDASGGSTGSGSSPANPGPDTCTSPNTAPLGSESDAVASAKAVLRATGLNPADFQWASSAPKDAGQPVIYVSASQVVDGQLTGMVESFTFGGGNKLSSAYGFAAPLVSLGSYDVVSAQDAVVRLGDPRFGSGYGGPIAYAADGAAGGVMPMMKSAVASDATAPSTGTVTSSPAPAPTMPTTPTSGSKFAWPVTHVTIVKADLGLAQYYEPNGSIVLIPTYQLTGSDKSTWTVIAVNESALDTTPVTNN